jgi:hypothetical protein
MSQAPPGIQWENPAADFIDALVDRDILYLDAQLAIEQLVQSGLHDRVTLTFDLDGRTIHWHRMPPIHIGLKALDIFTTEEQHGLIHVLYIRFATDKA